MQGSEARAARVRLAPDALQRRGHLGGLGALLLGDALLEPAQRAIVLLAAARLLGRGVLGFERREGASPAAAAAAAAFAGEDSLGLGVEVGEVRGLGIGGGRELGLERGESRALGSLEGRQRRSQRLERNALWNKETEEKDRQIAREKERQSGRETDRSGEGR